MAKWLKITIIIVLIAAIIGTGIWLLYYFGVFDKAKKYTYQELQDMYSAGYNDGAKTTTDMQIKIDNLEITITNLQNDITTKNNRITELENALSTKTSENEELQAELDAITTQRDNLLLQVQRLQEELEEYQNSVQEMVYVNFYNGNEIVDTKAVRKNGSILVEVEEPTSVGYVFAGWQLNDETIDITTFEFTTDTNLTAKFDIDPNSFLAYLQENLTSENCLHFGNLPVMATSFANIKLENSEYKIKTYTKLMTSLSRTDVIEYDIEFDNPARAYAVSGDNRYAIAFGYVHNDNGEVTSNGIILNKSTYWFLSSVDVSNY